MPAPLSTTLICNSSPSISNQPAVSTDEAGEGVPKQSNGHTAENTDTEQRTKPENTSLDNDEVANNSIENVDDGESTNLSPPPDSMSPISDPGSEAEVPNEGPEDEIVVGSLKKKSAAAASNDPALPSEESGNQDAMDVGNEDEDLEAGDEIDLEPQERPKRKRASIYEDLDVDKMDSSILGDKFDDFTEPLPDDVAAVQDGVPDKVSTSEKAVPLGVWRESEAPDPDKHVVKGFIDSRDRLRTRIQNHNREGKNVTLAYPLKPGPGGSWVTFHNIIFDKHLLNLDQIQVKEYVKIRAEMMKDEKEEQKKENDTAAVGKAIKLCNARGPPPENTNLPLPLIAYGAVIPDSAKISYSRAEKRRRNNAGKIASSTPDVQTTPMPIPRGKPLQAAPSFQPVQSSSHLFPDDLHGYRPTKILLGFWLESAEKDDVDKHAVFGILGNNDMFRVKVGRETRDGRHLQSNFPSGAGALWINTHQWQREGFLGDLTRDEIKEYCRVRQWQFDHGLRDTHEPEAIAVAINEARRRIANMPNKSRPSGPTPNTGNQFTDAILTHQPPPPPPPPTHETRQTLARRSGPAITPTTSSRDSPQTPGFRAANRPGLDPGHDPRLQRADSLASHAVSRIEASQAKVEERDAYAAGQQPANGHGGSFRENLGRLNNVWSSQEAQRIRSGNEDAKIHMGVKYERKQNGPFAGKLVSQGAIISIDGEDYVEYRVLTKPTFI